jgi:hypothetical protein
MKSKKLREEPWIKLFRQVLASDAWRSLGINARRFVDFLMIEHMNKGGKHNGKLRAPFRQLGAFGIGLRLIKDAIAEAEKLGLVDCHRGGMRVATTYALTWLPLHDGTPASDRWRAYQSPRQKQLRASKSRNLLHEGEAGLLHEGEADGRNLLHEGEADRRGNLLHEGEVLLRKFLPGEPVEGLPSIRRDGGRGGGAAPPSRPTPSEMSPDPSDLPAPLIERR